MYDNPCNFKIQTGSWRLGLSSCYRWQVGITGGKRKKKLKYDFAV